MERNNHLLSDIIAPLALLAIAAGMLAPLFNGGPITGIGWHCYTYAAGAIALLLCRLFSPYKGKDIRIKRLTRIEGWSALIFCVGAFFLFWPGSTVRDWLAFTIAGAVLQIFTSIAIPARQRKLAKGLHDGK